MAKKKKGSGGDDFGPGLLVGLLGGIGLTALAYHATKPDKGVLDQMREHILRDQKTMWVRTWAFSIIGNIPHTNALGRIARIYEWVTTNLKWKPDPASVDHAASLGETIKLGGGDCDCLTTAFCTLVEAAGHKASLLTVPKDNPNHVLALVPIHGSQVNALQMSGAAHIVQSQMGNQLAYWLPFDPSIEHGRPGILAPQTWSQVCSGDCKIHPIAS